MTDSPWFALKGDYNVNMNGYKTFRHRYKPQWLGIICNLRISLTFSLTFSNCVSNCNFFLVKWKSSRKWNGSTLVACQVHLVYACVNQEGWDTFCGSLARGRSYYPYSFGNKLFSKAKVLFPILILLTKN